MEKERENCHWGGFWEGWGGGGWGDDDDDDSDKHCLIALKSLITLGLKSRLPNKI